MIDSTAAITVMNDDDLIASTREIASRSNRVEAELLLYLGEIDARKIYRERASPSMIPAMLDALRSGAVHLTGLRVLVPRLTEENHEKVLALAAGKSKREIEELAAALAPQPPVPDAIRKLPNRELVLAAPVMSATSAASSRAQHRSVVAPLSADTFEIKFTASRVVRDKLRQAQDLLRHRIPNGNLAQVFEKALDTLIEKVLKERFAVGRKPRLQSVPGPIASASHEAPDAMKREVYERDEGRCAFTDEHGNRCPATGFLEFDHIEGYAQTRMHDGKTSRLLCRVHNQLVAEHLYGRKFMERLRQDRREAKAAARRPSLETTRIPSRTRLGASAQQRLL